MDVRAARLRGFLEKDPSNTEIACELADALCATGEHPQARQMLEALPDATLAAPGVQFRLGRCALMAGDYAQAEVAY